MRFALVLIGIGTAALVLGVGFVLADCPTGSGKCFKRSTSFPCTTTCLGISPTVNCTNNGTGDHKRIEQTSGLVYWPECHDATDPESSCVGAYLECGIEVIYKDECETECEQAENTKVFLCGADIAFGVQCPAVPD